MAKLTAQKCCKVATNLNQNRLSITIAGRLAKKDLDNLYTDIRFSVADLKPGFSVVTDLQDCSLANLGGLVAFRKIMLYLLANNVGTVVRIIQPKSLVYRQVLNAASRIQGYQAQYAYSQAEAEQILNGKDRRLGVRLQLHGCHAHYSFEGREGHGLIIDISQYDCAIRGDILPAVGTKLTVSLSLETEKENLERFSLAAKTTRADTSLFAVRFAEDIQQELRERLWHCLIAVASRIADNA